MNMPIQASIAAALENRRGQREHIEQLHRTWLALSGSIDTMLGAVTDLDDSGGRRGWLLMVLCRFSAVLSGSRGPGGWRCCPMCSGRHRLRLRRGGLLSGVAGTVLTGQAGAGRAHSRCQQVRNASFHGQVRLIFSTRARAWRTRRAGSAHNR